MIMCGTWSVLCECGYFLWEREGSFSHPMVYLHEDICPHQRSDVRKAECQVKGGTHEWLGDPDAESDTAGFSLEPHA